MVNYTCQKCWKKGKIQSDCPDCKGTGNDRPNNLVKIPVRDRTEIEHRQIMKWFYDNNIRKYLLSMGDFKTDNTKCKLCEEEIEKGKE